ncbi:MAG: hypothetical protein SGPRY_007720 [Prymnesium sp.]
MVFEPHRVIREGEAHGWQEHDYQWSQGELVILRKQDHLGERMQLNIWCTTNTVGSYLRHPRRGTRTQLFRRKVDSMNKLRKLLKNPRVHGLGGYYDSAERRKVKTKAERALSAMPCLWQEAPKHARHGTTC